MYDHKIIEKKWQKIWQETELYKTSNDATKPKYYILDMFPYPSGAGLHVGHPKGYIATDILARLKMMQGFNVLHPIGWDAFGLPAENYAIKTKTHPRVATEKNIAVYKEQLEMLGFTYDWSREIDTTDPAYYKWTQWAFIQMFKKGLVFQSSEPINWCPSCKTGLSNEDVEDGACERCGTPVEQKPLPQWVIKITDYAQRLLDDLEKLPHWEDSIKDMQRNWIGRSEGAEIDFKIKDSDVTIRVFTTRVDTIFGCTYVVLAPENSLIEELKAKIVNLAAVNEYCESVKNKTTLERTDLNKDKSGVLLQGLKAINPFNGEEADIFAADYVLNSYGTGAVMAVPAHDERDFAFAEKYNIHVKTSIRPENDGLALGCFTEDGVLVNSGEFTGLKSDVARQNMITWLEKNNYGSRKINFKIKDWVFSRQRYWGEPIPLIHCEKCGVVAVPEDQLPVTLPDVESYEPTGNGESPLAGIADWVNTTCPNCGGAGRRETNTMPQWAGSSWYYLRYIDPKNDSALVDKDLEKYWSPVDFYVGGAEHATRHLIYARFWHKFLFDIGVVSHDEPFTRLQHVGLIMGEDGQKMSKRWGNVINPNDIVEQFGADALRIYEMFMGPFSQAAAWNSGGLSGTRKFLDRIDAITFSDRVDGRALNGSFHKTIKKVGEDIADFKFNTAISSLMILINEIYGPDNKGDISKTNYILLLQLLAPFTPHLVEELWARAGEANSVFKSTWPTYSQELLRDDNISLAVQINGKLRTTIDLPTDTPEDVAKSAVLANEIIQKWLEDKEIVKIIFVPNKLMNIVIK
ncbi:MAG: leucine--tRNA ligase [Candidatus Falkowbacteria bacterium]